MTEDEMVGWHHRLDVHGFGWTLGVGDGQGGLACCGSWGLKESDIAERVHLHFSPSCIGEGNGNPLQCSWLENPRDGGAWWAAVYGVAQSRTRLKRLSSSSSRRSGFDPWVWKIPWRRAWQPLQCSCLENPMDRGAWQATVHRVTESQTQLK